MHIVESELGLVTKKKLLLILLLKNSRNFESSFLACYHSSGHVLVMPQFFCYFNILTL